MVQDTYLHDVARILEIPPRAIEFLKEFILIGDNGTVVLNAEAKVRLCEKMDLMAEYKGNKFPNVNLVNAFIQILSKKGAIVKEKRSVYRVADVFNATSSEELTLVITYSLSGRTMKLRTPDNEHLQEGMR